MKGIELLEQNPESAKLICSYYLEIMIESLKDEGLPEDFKESIREQGIDNEKISAIIDGNPRNLFDFFDDQELFIDINISIDKTFSYSIIEALTSVIKPTKTFSSRKDAEKDAINKAIAKLESTLTNSVSDKENS